MILKTHIKTLCHQQNPVPDHSCVRGIIGRRRKASRKAQDGWRLTKKCGYCFAENTDAFSAPKPVTGHWEPNLRSQVYRGRMEETATFIPRSLIFYFVSQAQNHLGWRWDQTAQNPSLWQQEFAQAAKSSTPSSEPGEIRMAEGASTFLNRFSPSLMEI